MEVSFPKNIKSFLRVVWKAKFSKIFKNRLVGYQSWNIKFICSVMWVFSTLCQSYEKWLNKHLSYRWRDRGTKTCRSKNFRLLILVTSHKHFIKVVQKTEMHFVQELRVMYTKPQAFRTTSTKNSFTKILVNKPEEK